MCEDGPGSCCVGIVVEGCGAMWYVWCSLWGGEDGPGSCNGGMVVGDCGVM